MAYMKKQTLKYVFSEKHKEYIRSCVSCEFNVAEGAVRAGKTRLIMCMPLHMS